MRWKLLIAAVAAAAAVSVQAQTKQELAQKVLQLQQPAIEGLARSIVERPAAQLIQAAHNALQTQVAPDKREAAGKSIESDVRKFVDESVPPLQKRALELAPSTLGTALQEKFSEDELKQLVAWLDSPVNKKYQQLGPEMQGAFVQKLSGEAGTMFDARLQALQEKVRATLATAQGSSRSNGGSAAPRNGQAASAPKK